MNRAFKVSIFLSVSLLLVLTFFVVRGAFVVKKTEKDVDEKEEQSRLTEKSKDEIKTDQSESGRLRYKFHPGGVFVYSFTTEGISNTNIKGGIGGQGQNANFAKIERQVKGNFILRILEKQDNDQYLASASVINGAAAINSSIPYKKYTNKLKEDLEKPILLTITSSGRINDVRIPRSYSLQGLIFWRNWLDLMMLEFPDNPGAKKWKMKGRNAYGIYHKRFSIKSDSKDPVKIHLKNVRFLRHLFGQVASDKMDGEKNVKESDLNGTGNYEFDRKRGILLKGKGKFISENLVDYMGGGVD